MAIASSVVSAAGGVMGGMQANAQAKMESDLAKRNSQMEVEAARESREMGKDEAKQHWRNVARTKGQNIAAMAANGIDVDYGSAERLQADTQLLANEDADRLYRNIEQRTRGRLINASNYTAEAKAAKRRGKAALVGSIFSGASTIMGGLSQASSVRSKMGVQ